MSDERDPILVETAAQRESRITWLVAVAVILSGVCAAIAYNIFNAQAAGWAGAAIGFGLSMLMPSVRRAVIEAVVVLAIFAALVVGVLFIIATFNPGEEKTTSDTPASQSSQDAINKQSLRERLKDTGTVVTAPKSDGIPAYCKSCKRLLTQKINQTQETVDTISANCATKIEECRTYGYTW